MFLLGMFSNIVIMHSLQLGNYKQVYFLVTSIGRNENDVHLVAMVQLCDVSQTQLNATLPAGGHNGQAILDQQSWQGTPVLGWSWTIGHCHSHFFTYTIKHSILRKTKYTCMVIQYSPCPIYLVLGMHTIFSFFLIRPKKKLLCCPHPTKIWKLGRSVDFFKYFFYVLWESWVFQYFF